MSMSTRTSRRWSRRALPGLEQLEARTVVAGNPTAASLEPAVPFPVEPLAPTDLCPQEDPGIYYDAPTDTLCIVGSGGDDRVSVSRTGAVVTAVLDTPELHFEFSANTLLVDRINIDVR